MESITKILLAIFCTFILCAATFSSAHAHRPHDAIADVAISPNFDKDGTAFAIVADRTLKSTRNHGDTWQVLNNGIDNVFHFSSLAISPAFRSNGLVLAATKGDGVYKSVDAGWTWKKWNNGFEEKDIRIVAISPFHLKRPAMAVADAVGKLYLATGDGAAWDMVRKQDHPITAVSFLPIAGEDEKKIIFGDSKGSLYLKTADQWSTVTSRPEWGAITCIEISPRHATDGVFWVGTEEKGLFKTADNGNTFSQLDMGTSDKKITSLKVYNNEDGTFGLYATTWNEALFRSDDGGRSWKKSDKKLSTDIQADAPDFKRPHFKGLAINQSTVLLAGFDGLFISINDAKSWYQAETWPVGTISMLSTSPVLDQRRQSAILAYSGGAYLIPDATSDNWLQQSRGLTLAGRPGVRTDSGISDIAFSPSFKDDQIVFAATEHEILKSADGGESWKRVNIKKPLSYRVRYKINHYLRKMGVSNGTRLKIAGFFPLIPGWSTYVAVSPDFDKDGNVFFSTQGLGQCLSIDSGDSCSIVLDTALQVTTSMAISPNYTEDSTLFIGIRSHGVFKTSDAGKSFTKLELGFPVNGNIKLAVSPEYPDDHTIFAGTGDGLLVSHDGGDNWRLSGESDLPLKGNILSVSISPNFKQDRTILLAVKGFGVFKSVDSGNSFSPVARQLLAQNEQLKQLIFSQAYQTDRAIFGISSDNVYKSRDVGETWKLIQRPIRYEDIQDIVSYDGSWETQKGGAYSDSSQIRSKAPGSKAVLRFVGSGLNIIGEMAPDYGTANVYLDGQLHKEISFNSKEAKTTQNVYSLSLPQKGVHEIIVEVSDTSQEMGWIAIDAFEVLP